MYKCDGCGKDLEESGGLTNYVTISRISEVNGMVENLHLCRKPVFSLPDAPQGCMERILTPDAMPFYTPPVTEENSVPFEPADDSPSGSEVDNSGSEAGAAATDPAPSGE